MCDLLTMCSQITGALYMSTIIYKIQAKVGVLFSPYSNTFKMKDDTST